MTRIGDWMQTKTGKRFYVFDPRAEEMDIEDIAHSLSMQCRFNGHTDDFYSVAQHSVYVSALVSRPAKLAALLHDGTETWFGDFVRPIKNMMPEYKAAENKAADVLYDKFKISLSDELWAQIKVADNRMCWFEAMAMKPLADLDSWTVADRPAPGQTIRSVDPEFYPWDHKTAKRRFLARLIALLHARHEEPVLYA